MAGLGASEEASPGRTGAGDGQEELPQAVDFWVWEDRLDSVSWNIGIVLYMYILLDFVHHFVTDKIVFSEIKWSLKEFRELKTLQHPCYGT